jgi:ubiquinone/menaquinone biosynthesis C-methylase UbiE
MAAPSGFQLQGNAARVYEAQKVPAIFRPLAELTLESITLDGCACVLDVACGTGIVARLLAERLGSRAKVVGVDVNRGMIAVARQYTSATGGTVEWHEADVGALPFDEGMFDLAICQQGLQFFPDKAQALQEIRRVLAPRGRIALTVWSEISPMFLAMADALRQHLNAEIAERLLEPFAFRDAQVIRSMMTEAGFRNITVQTLVLQRQIGPAAESMPQEFAGSQIAEDIAGLDQRTKATILRDIGTMLRLYEANGGLVIPQHTHLFEARVA